ncbi:MAG: hypothetical protein ACJAZK_002994 [Psychroserpens sp.]
MQVFKFGYKGIKTIWFDAFYSFVRIDLNFPYFY